MFFLQVFYSTITLKYVGKFYPTLRIYFIVVFTLYFLLVMKNVYETEILVDH